MRETQKVAEQKGSEFTFTGTDAVILGRWERDCGQADVHVDGKFIRKIDNSYWVMKRGAGFQWLNSAHLFHIWGLAQGKHPIRMVLTDMKNEKATGTKLRVSRAIVSR